MSLEIDWSHAPVGATHLHQMYNEWEKHHDGVVYHWIDNTWVIFGDITSEDLLWRMPRPTDEVSVERAQPKMSVEGYEKLTHVLQRAYDQASAGKGKDRHANSLPFHLQPMQRICDQVGVGFAMGQAIKKAQESLGLPRDRAVAEVLGAINYLAGVVIFMEKQPMVEVTSKVRHEIDPATVLMNALSTDEGRELLLTHIKKLAGNR